jgi:hypothetical protein
MPSLITNKKKPIKKHHKKATEWFW